MGQHEGDSVNSLFGSDETGFSAGAEVPVGSGRGKVSTTTIYSGGGSNGSITDSGLSIGDGSIFGWFTRSTNSTTNGGVTTSNNYESGQKFLDADQLGEAAQSIKNWASQFAASTEISLNGIGNNYGPIVEDFAITGFLICALIAVAIVVPK
jgi:hypothetical protein